MSREPKWLKYARRLQSISQAGLTYSENVYERERFKEIQDISMEIIKEHTHLKEDKIRLFFQGEKGYPTPKVDVRAAIFQGERILLVKEKVDGLWALPGGWADADNTLRENLIRESKEEAGVDIIPGRIIAIQDRKRYNLPPAVHGIYKIFVECEYQGGSFVENIETQAADFFTEGKLPPLSTGRNTVEQIKMCFAARKRPLLEPLFD